MKRIHLIIVIFFALYCSTAFATLKDNNIVYTIEGVNLNGYIVYDDKFKGPRPGILVVHEWWGQNEYARERARMLAELGYVALALDMFGEGKQAHHPKDAQKFAAEITQNIDLSKSRFLAAMEELRNHKLTNPQKIAAIGYCFGGAVVLQMAREGIDMKAVVSFHGGLSTNHPAEKGAVKAKILVAHGGADPFVKHEQLGAFMDEMNNAKADYRIVIYSGAKHGFTNPQSTALGHRFDIPLAYNREADIASWEEMRRFLKNVFD